MLKKKQIIISGLLACFFAVIGTAIVSITERQTHEQIIENEHQALLKSLYALIPPERFDNNLSHDTIVLKASSLLGNTQPQVAYRARKNNKAVAIIFNATAHNGYSGDIDLLIAINVDGTVAGVRAVKHTETPGLGDAIDIKKSNWITQFDLKSLLNPSTEKQWAVKKDGGDFDQMTGATITPRAIVGTLHKTLKYYEQHKDTLFQPLLIKKSEAKHEQ